MTQTEKIERHLKTYGSITASEAFTDYGIMRLAARIADLKKSGLAIKSQIVTGKNRFGESISFAKYSMEES